MIKFKGKGKLNSHGIPKYMECRYTSDLTISVTALNDSQARYKEELDMVEIFRSDIPNTQEALQSLLHSRHGTGRFKIK